MKKFFPIIISTAFVFSNFGCGTTAENTNLNNPANTSVNSNTESVQSNTNAVAINEPVPTFTDANTALAEGNKYFDANATEKAVEAYKQAVKLDPDLGEAYFKMGIAYSLLENEREAAQVVDETPTPSPAKKGKKEVAAKLTDSEKAFENAIKAYEKLVDKNPKDDVSFFNLGRSYNKLNKDKEAEKALRQAVKLKPEDVEYQTEFGAILVKLANYDEAVPVLKKAVSLDDSNSQAQELLEKAEAGKKRIDFGVKAAQQQMESARQKSSKSKVSNTAPQAEETPPPLPAPKPTSE